MFTHVPLPFSASVIWTIWPGAGDFGLQSQITGTNKDDQLRFVVKLLGIQDRQLTWR